MILLNKKIYHVVENHVIEIHVKQGTTVILVHYWFINPISTTNVFTVQRISIVLPK